MSEKTEPFSAIFRKWSHGSESGSHQLLNELEDRYRTAWQYGDLNDKTTVLDFIRVAQYAEGFDLIYEGIDDNDELVSKIAVVTLTSLIRRRHMDPSPDIRLALQRFVKRFPDGDSLARVALVFLEEDEERRNS